MCPECDKPWGDHRTDDELTHLAGPTFDAWFENAARHREGKYDSPLPSPANRKLIRERAGWTQEQVALKIGVSRHTITKWEMPAGRVGDRELPGREPWGELRAEYSKLLIDLA